MKQRQNFEVMKLQEENKRMQQAVDQYMEEIEHLKNLNVQHEKQIESLLKFNQRLLSIIQEEVNNNQSKLHQKSLQPISQVTQNDSQTMEQMMQSLQKTRKKLAARSQKGANYLAVQQPKNTNVSDTNKVYQYMNEVKDLQRSQRYVNTDKQYSEFGNKSSFSKKRQKKGSSGNKQYTPKMEFDQEVSIDVFEAKSAQPKPIAIDVLNIESEEQRQKKKQEYKKIEENIASTINNELKQMRKNSEMNHTFLDEKIDRLNKLSKQMTFNPEQKFSQLQSKIKLSPQIAAMVKKAMVKK